jgi:hypothetical protein
MGVVLASVKFFCNSGLHFAVGHSALVGDMQKPEIEVALYS